jgi:hypothetical protein
MTSLRESKTLAVVRKRSNVHVQNTLPLYKGAAVASLSVIFHLALPCASPSNLPFKAVRAVLGV